MTIALIAALVFVAVAHIVLLDRRDHRERDERAELLQRIQAPGAAVAEHHAATVPPAEPDEGFPMTDEEIAAQQKKDGVISWMEAVENGRMSMLEVPE